MSKHTPGPWWLQADGVGWYVECTPERGHSVAYVRAEVEEDDPDTPDAEKEANARLIAAAPDLLAVLQELEKSSRYWSEYDVPLGIVDRISAAIAKATGEKA